MERTTAQCASIGQCYVLLEVVCVCTRARTLYCAVLSRCLLDSPALRCRWMDGWMDGCQYVWLYGCIDAYLHSCVNAWMHA